jgi:hypothetical protein
MTLATAGVSADETIWAWLLKRQACRNPPSLPDRDDGLTVDEPAARHVNDPLAEAAGSRLSLVLAHPDLAQLAPTCATRWTPTPATRSSSEPAPAARQRAGQAGRGVDRVDGATDRGGKHPVVGGRSATDRSPPLGLNADERASSSELMTIVSRTTADSAGRLTLQAEPRGTRSARVPDELADIVVVAARRADSPGGHSACRQNDHHGRPLWTVWPGSSPLGAKRCGSGRA